VGVNLVITRPPDGYTLCIFPSAPIAVAAHMGKLNFHPLDDMTHILRYSGYTFGIVVRADSPWKTVQDFLQYAKQNPQKISFGSPGVGTTGHLAMEELSMLAGVQLIHVPYKGVAETNTALMGGHVDIVSDSSGWAPMVDAGKFRLLATYAQQRLARYPQAPTLKEVGYDVFYSSPLEIIGPKGLPRAVAQKVHEAFKKAMDDPDYQNTLKNFDMPNLYLNAEDVEKADRQEYERLGRLVLKLGLQPK
jgi:tripartite-type tricarboxylate transporter receptor subunit TctC